MQGQSKEAQMKWIPNLLQPNINKAAAEKIWMNVEIASIKEYEKRSKNFLKNMNKPKIINVWFLIHFSNLDKWIKCGNCKQWYHLHCLKLKDS